MSAGTSRRAARRSANCSKPTAMSWRCSAATFTAACAAGPTRPLFPATVRQDGEWSRSNAGPTRSKPTSTVMVQVNDCDGSSQPAVVSSATLSVLSAALRPVLFGRDAIRCRSLCRSGIEHAAHVWRSVTVVAMIETLRSIIHCCTCHSTLLGTLIMVLFNWLGRLASGLFKLAKRGGGLERVAARGHAVA